MDTEDPKVYEDFTLTRMAAILKVDKDALSRDDVILKDLNLNVIAQVPAYAASILFTRLIDAIDEEYNVEIIAVDLKACKTVGEVVDHIVNKIID